MKISFRSKDMVPGVPVETTDQRGHRFRATRGPKGNSPKSSQETLEPRNRGLFCIHQLGFSGRVTQGKRRRCGGIGIYDCDKLGQCTISQAVEGLGCCETCNHFELDTVYDEALRGASMKHDLYDFFSHVYVVNLDHRQDKREAFYQGLDGVWPFKVPEVVSAIKGRRCKPPEWFRAGGGAWGCFRSHLRIIEDALQRGETGNILILEDDAMCCDGFADKVAEFLAHLPADWQMIYLGGQHLYAQRNPPIKVNDYVYLAYNVNRTHAYAVSPSMLLPLYKHLNNTKGWHPRNHFDHHIGRLVQRRTHKVYAPAQWLMAQRASKSDITGRTTEHDRFWNHSVDVSSDVNEDGFIAVVGLHSAGTSCIAGVLYHLGVHLGNALCGYYGDQPGGKCGYEAITLGKMLESCCNVGATQFNWVKGHNVGKFKNWIRQKKIEARRKKTVAGAKHPLLSAIGPQLLEACGDSLAIVNCVRPIEHSIQSLSKRFPTMPLEKVAAHQRWLDQCRGALVESAPLVVDVDYYQLLSDPEKVVAEIRERLGLNASDEQMSAAIASVDPDQRHVGSAA